MDDIIANTDQILSWQMSWLRSLNLIQLAGEQAAVAVTHFANVLDTAATDVEAISNKFERLVINNNIIVGSIYSENAQTTTNSFLQQQDSIVNNTPPFLPQILEHSSGEETDIPHDVFNMMVNKTGKSFVEWIAKDEKLTDLLAKNITEGLGEEAGGMFLKGFSSVLGNVGLSEVAGLSTIAETAGALLAPEISIPIIIGGALWSIFSDDRKRTHEISYKDKWVAPKAGYESVDLGNGKAAFVTKPQQAYDYSKLKVDASRPIIAADNTRYVDRQKILYPVYVHPELASLNRIANFDRKQGMPPEMIEYHLQMMKKFWGIEDDVTKQPVHQDNSGKGTRDLRRNTYSSNNTIPRQVNININRPFVENLIINAKSTNEGYDNLKHKLEQLLLEILNEAKSS